MSAPRLYVRLPCAKCGKEVKRHRDKYCCLACYGAASRGVPKRRNPDARVPRGEAHHNWVGDRVSTIGGRRRAVRMYPDAGMCRKCGKGRAERHHKDGNTAHNEPSNIAFLCRRCHMEEDGRLERLRTAARRPQTSVTAP